MVCGLQVPKEYEQQEEQDLLVGSDYTHHWWWGTAGMLGWEGINWHEKPWQSENRQRSTHTLTWKGQKKKKKKANQWVSSKWRLDCSHLLKIPAGKSFGCKRFKLWHPLWKRGRISRNSKEMQDLSPRLNKFSNMADEASWEGNCSKKEENWQLLRRTMVKHNGNLSYCPRKIGSRIRDHYSCIS